MKCPKCVAEGERSTVYGGGGGMTTLLGFSTYYDEDGVFHSHDPNRTSSHYRCSRGHSFGTSTLTPCPSCDYGRAEGTAPA